MLPLLRLTLVPGGDPADKVPVGRPNHGEPRAGSIAGGLAGASTDDDRATAAPAHGGNAGTPTLLGTTAAHARAQKAVVRARTQEGAAAPAHEKTARSPTHNGATTGATHDGAAGAAVHDGTGEHDGDGQAYEQPRGAPIHDGDEGPIRIVLADDHAAMRQSLRLLLDGEADIDVIAETDSFGSVLEHVRSRRPDVLVLDLGMPDRGSGIETLARLRGELRDTEIVVLTMNDDPAWARRALDSGATALVLKEMADSDLPPAVRGAWRGERYLSPTIARKLGEAGEEPGRLTPREREVLHLIALGHTSVEIAEMLKLSPRTIETHRARIHRKLGLGTRAELVGYALRYGLLRP